MKIKFGIFDYNNPKQTLSIGFTPPRPMISGLIMEFSDSAKLLSYMEHIIDGKIKENEYWTNGYTAKITENEGRKMIKVFFRLTDEYAPDYLSIEEFRDIIEFFYKEKEKFEADPASYKTMMVKNGAKVINIEKYQDNERRYTEMVEGAEKGVVVVKNRQEKLTLEKAAGIKK